MKHSNPLRAPLLALLLFVPLGEGCATPELASHDEPMSETREATFVVTRRDLRECTWPACGGLFVAEVNAAETLCADGERAAECYVAELDWSALEPGDEQRAPLDGDALEGRLMLRARMQHGEGMTTLQVIEAQRTVAGATLSAEDTFYTVRFNGLMCATSPCPSFDAVAVNGEEVERFAAVNLEEVAMTDAEYERVHAALGSEAGLSIVATRFEVSGIAGTAPALRAHAALLPLDTGLDSCPAADDPSVHYASDDPDTCRVILFHCDETQSYFGGDCGCGCVDSP